MRLEELVGACILGALIVYALSGGADYGAGVWELLAFRRVGEKQRELIAEAIAPIWEADHVWLIAAIVMLFMGLPGAFAAISTWLHLPLFLMLLGVVLRGSAFVFWRYGARERSRRAWHAVFALASIVTPITLGVIIAAVASGRVPSMESAGPGSDYVSLWLAPFPLCVGLLTAALFAYLAAVYLCVEARELELRELFRRRALGASIVSGALAWLAFFLARDSSARLAERLGASWWSAPFHAATAASAGAAMVALLARRYRLARIFAAAQIVLILMGWGLAQYPFAIPPHLTLSQAAAPASVLRALLACAALGALVALPAFAYLLKVFKGRKVL